MSIFDAFKKKRQNPYTDMREMAFGVTPEQLGVEVGPDTVLMASLELNILGVVSTLLTMVEGSTSMYFETGGGIIGAGQHENVRQAGDAFREEMQRSLHLLEKVSDAPPPTRGMMRLHAVTPSGIYSVEGNMERILFREQDPLHKLASKANDLITQVRLASDAAQQRQ